MRRLACLAAVLWSTTLPLAHAMILGEITRWGETAADPAADPAANPVPTDPGTGLGPETVVGEVTYLGNSDQIEAGLCRKFGATVVLTATDDEFIEPEVEVRIQHPLVVRPDGAASTEDRFTTHSLTDTFNAGFSFDHAWEMQPGTWVIAFYARGERVAAKAFTVRLPPPGRAEPVCADETA